MTEHTVKAFAEDITRIRGLIAEMGGLAEVAVQDSMDALINGDGALADAVVVRSSRSNNDRHTVVEAEAVKYLDQPSSQQAQPQQQSQMQYGPPQTR